MSIEIPSREDEKKEEFRAWGKVFWKVIAESRLSGTKPTNAKYWGSVSLSDEIRLRCVVDPSVPDENGNPESIQTDFYFIRKQEGSDGEEILDHAMRSLVLARWKNGVPEVFVTSYSSRTDDEDKILEPSAMINFADGIMQSFLPTTSRIPNTLSLPLTGQVH